MEDMENVLMELSSLEKTPQVATIPPCLDEYLASVASTGKAVFAWSKVKPLFKRKLELIIQEFSESCPTENLARQPNVDLFNFEQMKERIFEQLESYTGLPFTVQRLCELMVQPKKHYKRIDKYMRGLEKVMLVVSTVDPVPGTGEDANKTDSSGASDSFESPSKRIRLASSEEDEAGPCDSADSEAGPSAEHHNGVNGTSEAGEAGSDVSGGEENMDIDTECTSSQARLSVTDTADTQGSDVQSGSGVESSADPAPSVHLDTDTPMDTETEDRLSSDPSPVASSSSVCEAGVEAGDSDGVSTSDQAQDTEAATEDSGAASSSGDQTSSASRSEETDTNSEAEPAASEMENTTEAVREETEAESSAQVAEEQQIEVASPSVQSSEEPSQTESSAPPATHTDSGAADSSDQAQAPGSEVTASEAGGEATPSVTPEAAEAPSSDQASDNSPDQSDSPAQ